MVDGYLRRRGLSVELPVLRGHPALAYHVEDDNGGWRFVGNLPAVVAPVTAPDGTLASVHRIYLGDVPDRKKTMRPASTIKGAAVRLFPHNGTLGISEGIETALACYELFKVPTWAALTAGGVEAFHVPPEITRLIIYGDADLSFTGQAAAYALAKRVVRDRPDIAVEVEIPDAAGTDWLNVLERGA